MKRASATYRLALEIVAIQLAERGHCLICPLCSQPIPNSELAMTGRTIREHMLALVFGGADKPWNMRIVCKICADLKTNGKRTIGKLGGDNSEGKRAIRHERNRIHGKPKSKNPIPSRPFPKPPKGMKQTIPGRRFNGDPIREGQKNA